MLKYLIVFGISAVAFGAKLDENPEMVNRVNDLGNMLSFLIEKVFYMKPHLNKLKDPGPSWGNDFEIK